MQAVVQQLSMGMGVAAGAVALRIAGALHHNSGEPDLGDFRTAFAMVSVLALVAVFDCFGLDRHAGEEVSGHRPKA
jgi:hypothetical protein